MWICGRLDSVEMTSRPLSATRWVLERDASVVARGNGIRPCERYNGPNRQHTDEKMVLKDIPTIDELAETTGQSREQLLKDREAAVKLSGVPDDE
jgi:hypothetical protein